MANIQIENIIHGNENSKAGLLARGLCVNMLWTDKNATSKKGNFSIPSLDIQNIYKLSVK